MNSLKLMEGETNSVKLAIRDYAISCPKCGERHHGLSILDNRAPRPKYAVSCTKCGRIGPLARTVEQAARLWNEKPTLFDNIRQSLRF
jgi:hypothetical protein